MSLIDKIRKLDKLPGLEREVVVKKMVRGWMVVDGILKKVEELDELLREPGDEASPHTILVAQIRKAMEQDK